MKICGRHLHLFLTLALLAISQLSYAGAEAKPKQVPISGKVLETMDSGGYSYVLLKTGNDKMWVAAPQMKVTVGQELKLVPGYEMKNFNSKGLNRKFDRIVFSAGVLNSEVKLPEAAVKMAHAKAVDDSKGAPAAKPAKTSSGPVAKAKGPNAYTIAQVYAKRQKLEKKVVTVRGRVTKVAERIMKHNWVHIEDGTGNKGKKTSELVVTTKDLPKEGEIVTVRGTLYNNKDFGSGYRYDVLIQEASCK
ncbi:MAG TPA: OB-fold nucleic acid binding domain-containing protein [Geomonas sp.]|nr:OB-fold nucleic acid binding domain-containing protein [Geomonas sp.]